MPIAIDPNETTEYVLACDRELPPDKQTVFLIAPLTVAQWRKCEAKVAAVTRGGVTTEGSAVEYMHEKLRCGLRGWRNFVNRAGDPVEFVANDGRPTDETLARLSQAHRLELAEAIRDMGKIEADDAGKSGR